MKQRFRCGLLALSMLLSIVGCSAPDDSKASQTPIYTESQSVQTQNNFSATMDTLSQGQFPPMADIRALSGNEEELTALLKKVGDIINDTSADALYQVINDVVDGAIASQDILELDHFDFDLSNDDLSMDVPNNIKLYNNITVRLNLYYEKEQFANNIVKEYEATQELGQHILLQLKENTYMYYTLKDIDCSFFTTDHQKRFTYFAQHSLMNHTMSRKQTAHEEMIQALVYEYVLKLDDDPMLQSGGKRPGHNRDVVLTKFGVVEESLYMEILIYAIDSGDNSQRVVDSFSGYSQELFDLIISNEQCAEYLKEKNVKSIHIVFDVPWYSGRMVGFDFLYDD